MLIGRGGWIAPPNKILSSTDVIMLYIKLLSDDVTFYFPCLSAPYKLTVISQTLWH